MAEQVKLFAVLTKASFLSIFMNGRGEEVDCGLEVSHVDVLWPSRCSHTEEINRVYFEIGSQVLHHLAKLDPTRQIAVNHEQFR